MGKFSLFLSILLFSGGFLTINPCLARTFTDTQNRTIEAELISVEDGVVRVRRSDGREFSIPIKNLSQADQDYIEDFVQSDRADQPSSQPEEPAEKLNQLFGIPLFEGSSIWDENPEVVAKRLGWPRESKTESFSSFRIYPDDSYSILNARPYSAVLYGEDGRAKRVSIVFANKGDLETNNRDRIEEAIENDAEEIERLLIQELGEAKRINMGRYDMKERVSRWDWEDHAILLSEQDGEYVSLRIMPVSVADNRGFSSRIPKSEMRDRLERHVVREPNGDVRIKGIPMVDQGPKGYCVPATFERYLRFLSIPADMYILAMAGQTGIGGGTDPSKIVENVQSYVSYSGRDLEKERMKIDIKDIADFVDEGIPIMWTLLSGMDFNEIANQRTLDRSKQKDWEEWKERCQAEDEEVKSKIWPDYSAGHMCMIVGYNEETGELAISDSWGKAYELRWITVGQAERVSREEFYIIDL